MTLTRTSAGACATACLANANCKGFVYTPSTRSCSRYDTITLSTIAASATTAAYIRKATTGQGPSSDPGTPAPYLTYSGLSFSTSASGTSVTSWSNTGTSGSHTAANLSGSGTATVLYSLGRPHVAFATSQLESGTTVDLDLSDVGYSPGGWTIVVYACMPATGLAGDSFFQCASVPSIQRASTSAQVEYALSGTALAAFGTSALLDGSTWQMLTAVTTADSYTLYLGTSTTAVASGTLSSVLTTTTGTRPRLSLATAPNVEIREVDMWLQPLEAVQLSTIWAAIIAKFSPLYYPPPPTPPPPTPPPSPPPPPLPTPTSSSAPPPPINTIASAPPPLPAPTTASSSPPPPSSPPPAPLSVDPSTPLPYISLDAASILGAASGTFTSWANTGTAGAAFDAQAILGAGGSIELGTYESSSYITLTNAYIDLGSTGINWDTSTSGDGWTIMVIMRGLAVGAVAEECIYSFSEASGSTGYDSIMLLRDELSSTDSYEVTSASGGTLVSASCGTVFDAASWYVVTVTCTASSYLVMVNGVVVDSGATDATILSRITTRNWIGRSSVHLERYASGLQLMHMSVWLEALSVTQLQELANYEAAARRLRLIQPRPNPEPELPTCSKFPAGWSEHCSSCGTTACLRDTCSDGLKVSSSWLMMMMVMIRMLLAAAVAVCAGSLSLQLLMCTSRLEVAPLVALLGPPLPLSAPLPCVMCAAPSDVCGSSQCTLCTAVCSPRHVSKAALSRQQR